MTTDTDATKHATIQAAILGVMIDIAKTGILKSSVASLGGAKINYRGIEAAMNQLSVLLIRHGIAVTPQYSCLEVVDRPRDEGKNTRAVTVLGAFRFAIAGGDHVTAQCFGEANDTGDKAVTKAQSVAFRTALFQTFVVPTIAMDPEQDDDDDGGNADLLAAARVEAKKGLVAYQHFFSKTCTAEDRLALKSEHSTLKSTAEAADRVNSPGWGGLTGPEPSRGLKGEGDA